MLFRRDILERIRAGEITLAFRRWVRPTVSSGGRLRTAIGELVIEDVRPVDAAALSEDAARRSGFAGRAALIDDLRHRVDGQLYRIAIRYAGPDGRTALRADDRLSAPVLAEVAHDLAKLDRIAATGPCTMVALTLIAERPGQKASDLADAAGLDLALFKRRVRQLKERGLTESLQVGYRLSPRGQRILRHAGKRSADPSMD